MTGKEREKLGKYLKEGETPEKLLENEFLSSGGYKILRKIFAKEAKKSFEKKGFLTDKKEWELCIRGTNSDMYLTVDVGEENTKGQHIEDPACTCRRTYRLPVTAMEVLRDWLSNDKTLFSTLKKSDIYLFSLQTKEQITVKEALYVIQSFLKREGRYQGESHKVSCSAEKKTDNKTSPEGESLVLQLPESAFRKTEDSQTKEEFYLVDVPILKGTNESRHVTISASLKEASPSEGKLLLGLPGETRWVKDSGEKPEFWEMTNLQIYNAASDALKLQSLSQVGELIEDAGEVER